MALLWPIKDPSEKKDYGLDWTAELAGATIVSSTWSVPPGIVQDTPNPTFTATTTTIWLSGGTLGKTYELTNTVTDSADRVLVQSVDVPVQAK